MKSDQPVWLARPGQPRGLLKTVLPGRPDKPAGVVIPARQVEPAGPAHPARPAMPDGTVNSVLPACPAACQSSSTMLIALSNTKGGVGKSTLSAHLAIWLFDQGYRVALLDTDRQQTSARWIQAAEPEITVVSACDMDSIRQARGELLATHQIVVADTPGKENDATQTVTFLADLAIVPLQPSKPDLRAIQDALKVIRLAQEVSGGQRPQAVLVLYLTAKGDVQSRILRRQLGELGLPVAKSEIRRLNALRDACDTAVTRLRPWEARQAAADIEALFTEVLGERLAAIEPVEVRASRQEAANA